MLQQSKIIMVPHEYKELILDISIEYYLLYEKQITKESPDVNVITFCNAMGFIKKRIERANDGDFPIEYNWAVSLVDAVSDKYPNDGQRYPDEVEKLKGFLKEQTGRA